MSYLATISKKGLVTIPSEIRRKYGLKEGDKVYFVDKEGVLFIVPVSSVKELYGFGQSYRDQLIACIKELEAEHGEEVKREKLRL